MALNTPKRPSFRVEQAKKFLFTFYEKPIAQVSTELFFTIGATIFFAIFAIRPTILTMTNLVKEIQDKKEAEAALDQKISALFTVQTEYFALEQFYPLLDQTVLTNYDVEKVIATIERQASDEQLNISGIQVNTIPLPETEEIEFNRKEEQPFNVTVTVNGEFEQIKTFLLELTKKRPLLRIDSVDLSGPTPEDPRDYLSATIRMEAFFYGKKPPSASDERNRNDSEDSDPNLEESEE